MIQLAKKEELDIDLDNITNQRMRHILVKVRFINNGASGPGTEEYKIRISDLTERARSYGMDVPKSFCFLDGSET